MATAGTNLERASFANLKYGRTNMKLVINHWSRHRRYHDGHYRSRGHDRGRQEVHRRRPVSSLAMSL